LDINPRWTSNPPRAINPNNQKAPPRFFGARSVLGATLTLILSML
jgi:hypothetical protein